MTEDTRLDQRLLVTGDRYEVRVFRDIQGDLVVMWWDFDPASKKWTSDHGAKVPKAGLVKLTEFLLEAL